MDTCVELLVRKPKSKKKAMLLSLMGGVGVVLFLHGLMYFVGFTILGVIMAYVAYYLLKMGRTEYEYLCLGQELTVDKIKNQSKRKTVATYQLSRLEIMAPKGSHRLDSYQNVKVSDFSSETEEGNPYELVVEGANGRERILLDTNEEFLEAIKMAAPRKVFAD